MPQAYNSIIKSTSSLEIDLKFYAETTILEWISGYNKPIFLRVHSHVSTFYSDLIIVSG